MPTTAKDPSAPAPAWRAFVHLYLPVITSTLLLILVGNPFEHRSLLLASALPTYLLGSFVYQPRPQPNVRFTRRSDLHRAAVLFTYGRILRTPFRLNFFIADLIGNYAVDYVVGRSEVPRTSDFLVYGLWTFASGLLMYAVPPSWELLWVVVVTIDRLMWRASYLALVDDLVRVLAHPDLSRTRGVVLTIVVQAFMIALLVMWVFFMFVFGARQRLEAETGTL